MPEDDPITSFFVKFKQNIDTHIASAFHGALGIPSVVSKSTHASGRWPEPMISSSDTRSDNSSSDGSHDSSTATSRKPRAHTHETIWSLLPMQTLLDVEAVSDSLYQLMWMSFLIDSDYSPLRLRHLPRPTPNDLPEGVDASMFGFEDAFEDLLSVTSGQGLTDMEERCAMKAEWQRIYPEGLPPLMWLHQLTRQGLWDGWESRPNFVENIASERWKRWLASQDDPFRGGSSGGHTRNHAEHETHDALSRPSDHDHSDSNERAPEIEEDMYRLFEQGRAITESLQSGLDILRRLGEPSSAKDDYVSDSASDRALDRRERAKSTAKTLPEGWREEVKVDERTDGEGYTTASRTRVVYDDQDRAVSTTTETRTSRSVSFESTASGRRGESHDDSGSWFWK